MVNEKDTITYRKHGTQLTAEEREKLLQPYLPSPRNISPAGDETTETQGTSNGVKSTPQAGRRKRLRPFLRTKIHVLVYYLIHLFFGIYIRIRQIYHAVFDRVLAITYYHHRTPDLIRKDVKNLSRLPEHLSVLLTLRGEEDGGLEALMDEVAELSAWCTSAGIPQLSVYEKTGVLKAYMSSLHELVTQKLKSYFGPAPATPTLKVYAPNQRSVSPSPPLSSEIEAQPGNGHVGDEDAEDISRPHLDLLLLSYTDGRDTLVDLTRTLTDMSQSQKINPRDITSDLINTEITATTALPHTPSRVGANRTDSAASGVGSGEPDLLIVFGPYVKLDGYPPWQVRLTEIFCVGDSAGNVSGRRSARVEYQAFLRGLWRYGGAEMRFGR